MTASNPVTEQHADLTSSDARQASAITVQAAAGQNLQGGPGSDSLYASEGNDTISGNGGSDRMWGYGGDDYIISNDPDDDTRAGYDDLFGFDGNDTLLGGRGSDNLNGQLGNDLLDGGAGNDQLRGELGNDTLQGGAGHDTLNDYEGRDLLAGGAGVDLLYSERGGSSLLDGGDGNDVLLGDGQDTYLGGAGADRITIRTRANEAATTTLADGGAGNDLFSVAFLNQGTARVTGGGGRDVYLLERESGPAGYVVTDFAAGPEGDRIDASTLLAGVDLSLGDPMSSERGYLKPVQDGADTLLQFDADGAKGTASAFKTVLRLEGVAAASVAPSISTSVLTPAGIDDGETFIADGRNDDIFGSPLNDRYEGNGGADTVQAGAGNDTLLGGDGGDSLFGESGDDWIEGGEGNDVAWGGAGSNTLLGGAGNDTLSTDYAGNSVLDAGDGNDILEVGGWASVKFGTVQLSAGAGDDKIDIAQAPPEVTVSASGGSGQDSFRLSLYGRPENTANVTLTDFSAGAGGDLLDLSLAGPSWNYTGNPFGADGYLRLEQRGADTVLRYDNDGAAGSAHTLVDMLTLRNVTATSLTSANFKQGYDPAASFFSRVLTGTAGADNIQGDARAEQLIGLGGSDTLLGGGGDDLAEGGDDGDLLQGGSGNDSLFGGTGDDTLAGEAGNDSVVGGAGKDVLSGGAGDDILSGDFDDDILTDVEGNNVLTGGYGHDVIVTTGSGSDKVDGGDGDDTLTGGAGDTLDGGTGWNRLSADFTGGATGAVRMLGSAGDDVYTFGPSLAFQDVIVTDIGYGGNTYVFAPGSHAGQVTITHFDLDNTSDVIDLDALVPQVAANYVSNPFGALGYLRLLANGSSTLVQVDDDGAAGSAASFRTILTIDAVLPAQLNASHIVGGMNPNGSEDGIDNWGSHYSETINGGRGNDTLDGAQGDDTVYGFQGNDVLKGGTEDDSLYGGLGNDLLEGEEDNDSLFGEDGADSLLGGAGDDKLDGGSGDDLLDGGIGNDTLGGGDGADIVKAGDGDDSVDGGAGNDELNGGEGSDVLHGGVGTDTINGGNGDDALFADAGDDVLDGGAGNDTLDGGSGSVQLNGGSGNDVLKVSGSGNSGLFGGRGADLIEIAATQQTVAGRVVASGGDDADSIVVTRGALDNTAVNASGGAGIDTFVLRGEGRLGSLTVKDFAAGVGGDRIDLAGLAAPGGVLEFVQSGSATLVRFDADGAAGPLAAATLMTLQNVLATSMTSDNVVGLDAGGAPVELVGVPGAAQLIG
ncbi:calcium-binding protein [Massilia scottii]|uniref:calcium-binding protein n=1 Tax=Massilia scottii TaxID=3057166 RepID=UPI002796D0DD|nr:calcium-binding protein [Massilia sp. CCM 9029]MDQ1831939.1 calcium-binding protein [Massilia sp. CCM 9029]